MDTYYTQERVFFLFVFFFVCLFFLSDLVFTDLLWDVDRYLIIFQFKVQ